MEVICKSGITLHGKIRWLCKCHCGKEYEATGVHIKQGRSQHCGCLKGPKISAKNKIHGMTGTKEFKAWESMRRRCNSISDKDYHRYGGRGIKVCSAWNNFDVFYSDMGNAPTRQHSIDRIDVNGNYEPSNCRWATSKQQASNRRNNIYIDKESRSLLWERFGHSAIYQRALWRIKHKSMGIADAVFQPAGTI